MSCRGAEFGAPTPTFLESREFCSDFVFRTGDPEEGGVGKALPVPSLFFRESVAFKDIAASPSTRGEFNL